MCIPTLLARIVLIACVGQCMADDLPHQPQDSSSPPLHFPYAEEHRPVEEHSISPDYYPTVAMAANSRQRSSSIEEVELGARQVGQRGPLRLTEDEIKEAFAATSSREEIQYPALEYRKHVSEFRHQQNLKPNQDASDLDKAQYVYQYATKYLMDKKKAPYEAVRDALLRYDLSRVPEVRNHSAVCEKLYRVKCDPGYRYRSLDGSCNNLKRPTWGKTLACMPRIFAPAYDDGLSAPRSRMSSGRPLPNPREVSSAMGTVDGDEVPVSKKHTHMLMAFGQMLDHDIALTPETRGHNMTSIQCCPYGSAENVPSCYPVYVYENDTFYSQHKVDCINFVRSSGCTTCTIHPREQTNQQTAYVDASHVYGTSPTELDNVRDPDRPGYLLVRPDNKLLPPSLTPTTDGCSDINRNMFCFRAGDRRINQQPGIAGLQTILARQHNRLADQLTTMNPHWGNDRVFNESRRILEAQLQNIVYGEFLPVVLGPAYTQLYGLNLREPKYRTTYAENVNPSILNEFTTAAYRFGHALVMDFQYVSFDDEKHVLDLKNYYFNVGEFYEKDKMDDLLRGLSRQAGKGYGHDMVEDVKNYLYRNTSDVVGLDLASINIQRGREHGIPGYGHYLRWCSGRRIRYFEDLLPFMTSDNIRQLRKFYDSPYDVDLWVGGLYEKPVVGGIVGTTFACIIGLQFQNIRYGDRFFFTHGPRGMYNPGILFSPAQVQQIYSSSLAKLVCANSDSPDKFLVQPRVFLPISEANPLFYCRDLPDTNLGPWMERPPAVIDSQH